jgi:hypothetical protein
LRSWTFWLVLASPLLGLAGVSLVGRLTSPRALGAAVAAGLVAEAVALWRGGLMIGGPRTVMTGLVDRLSRVDYAWMLGWAAAYALVIGAIAMGLLRAAGWRR